MGNGSLYFNVSLSKDIVDSRILHWYDCCRSVITFLQELLWNRGKLTRRKSRGINKFLPVQGSKFSSFLGPGIKILGKNMGSITKQYTSLGPCEVAEEREGKFRSVKAGYRLKINNNKISAYLKWYCFFRIENGFGSSQSFYWTL